MKKILIASYNMIVGGSTTALIGLLNAIDKSRYDVDLVLYKNEGKLLGFIPKDIHILPEAFTCSGKQGVIKKWVKGLFSGYLVKARMANARIKKKGMSQQVLYDFQVSQLSRAIPGHYDIAIGFLEGWSDRYIVSKVNADIKIGWLHSTFEKIGVIPKLEERWMEKVDKIACVSQSCVNDFANIMPRFKAKTSYIPNIIDAGYIRTRAADLEPGDCLYESFVKSNCFKIVSICRLSMETKGLDRMVAAADRLVRRGYKFIWYVVGEGNDRAMLEEMIREKGLQRYFILTGVRINPYPYLKAADIMCMASRWEGMPSTVTEAKILGVPSVVTEYLSAHEQIKQGLEGIIVKNDDGSIEKGLRWCLDNKRELSKMHDYLLSEHYGNEKDFQLIESILFESEIME